jgi:IS5 family transposase
LNERGVKVVEMGKMKAKKKPVEQKSFLLPTLAEQLDARRPIYQLAGKIPWGDFEEEFGAFYSEEGRPAKPVRLMVGLLILKQLHDLGDETVVEAWRENPYWQYFCGETEMQWGAPCEPSDLVHFRHRIGEAGMQLILAVSIQLHGPKGGEKEVVIDTTVQEKNVTQPTDTKLYRKVITRCWKLADKEQIQLRRRYGKEVRKCLLAQRGRGHWRTVKKAQRATRKLKTLAGRLVRELGRKLSVEALEKHQDDLQLYRRVLAQKRNDRDKIYSLHEPHLYCVAKGKEHKKYEFGTKASVVLTKTSGIIVGAVAHERNIYDGHTLPEVLQQTEALTGRVPAVAIVDRGYRGTRQIGETEILVPGPKPKDQTPHQTRVQKLRFRRRCAIEPVIGHLKSDYRLARNYLKGFAGDSRNLLLAAAAWNFNKWLNLAVSFYLNFLRWLLSPIFSSSLRLNPF